MSKKTYDFSNPRHIDEIRELLASGDDLDPATTENLGEESDISSEDYVEEREYSYFSESEAKETSGEEDSNEDNGEYFSGRDKTTKWFKNPPLKSKRKSSHNIITHLPGVKGPAKNAKNALECWSLLFPDDLLEIIVKFTNQYIDTMKGNFTRDRDAKPTDLIEIKAFLGLLYLAGAYKSNHLTLEDLWGKNGDGIEKFGLVMNIRRFKFLLRYLRFDDRSSRGQRKQYDRLAPIREVFEMFVSNCQKYYTPGENLTIDFRKYVPSKPNKYGLEFFALVDAKMIYTVNLEIYTGKQPDGPYQHSNKPYDVVMRLVKPVLGTGRNITADDWFTEFDLVKDLRSHKLSYVGTVRKNKRALPSSFVNAKGKEQFSSQFGFNDGLVLTSYVPHKNESVVLVSSLHSDKAIDESSGQLKKPELITFYNGTKSGVDTADRMCATYSVQRNTQRWPMLIFYSMLNIGGINANIIYFGNQLESVPRRTFLKNLAHELCVGELHRRVQNTTGLHSSLQVRLKRILPVDDSPKESPPPKKRSRCCDCTIETGKRRLTNYSCAKCQRGICLTHANSLCRSCYSACQCEPWMRMDEEESE